MQNNLENPPDNNENKISGKDIRVKSSLKKLALTLAILAFLWIVLRYAVTPMVLGKNQNDGNISENIDNNLLTRIEKLETKIADLENNLENNSFKDSTKLGNITAISELSKRISELEEEIMLKDADSEINSVDYEKETQQQIDIYSSKILNVFSEEIKTLKDEINSIKNSEHQALRVVILLGHIENAINQGRAFSSESSELAILRPDMQEAIKSAEKYSIEGVATIERLKQEFAVNIKEFMVDSEEETIANNLKSLVRIRKIGEKHSGSDDQAIIARAEAKLAKNDIEASLQEIESLSKETKEIFGKWQERANDYLSAQTLIKKLRFILNNSEIKEKSA